MCWFAVQEVDYFVFFQLKLHGTGTGPAKTGNKTIDG